MIEELAHPGLEIYLIPEPAQAVPLSGIGEEDHRLFQEAAGVVELNPHQILHRRIGPAVQVEQGGVHVLDPGNRRLALVEFVVVVGAYTVASLAVYVVLVVVMATPTEEDVELEDQVDRRCPCGDCSEHVRAGGYEA